MVHQNQNRPRVIQRASFRLTRCTEAMAKGEVSPENECLASQADKLFFVSIQDKGHNYEAGQNM